MTNYDKRLNRLATHLPDQATRLGCRRSDHDLRARVENVPEDEPKREEVLERRRAMVRETAQETARVRIVANFLTQGREGRIDCFYELRPGTWTFEIQLDGDSHTTQFSERDFEVIG